MSRNNTARSGKPEKGKILSRLLGYIGRSRILVPLAFLSAIISALANLLAPSLIGKAIDHMIGPGQVVFSALFKLAAALALTYLLSVLFTWLLTYFSNRLAYQTANRLRVDLYNKMNRLPLRYFDNNPHGDTISRFINDVDAVVDGMLQGVASLMTGVVTIAGAIAFMLPISPVMTLVVILSAPFAYLVAGFITKRSQKYFGEQARTLGRLNGYAEEMIAGQHTVKAFHYETTSVEKFEAVNQELFQVGTRSQFYGAMANPTTRLINNTIYSVIGVTGAVMAIMGSITVGNISSFLIYSNLFSKPFNEITSVITQIQTAFASCGRIFALLDEEEEIKDAPDARELSTCEGNIRFDHVAFSYVEDKPLIADLNLDVKAGSRIAIVGRTGAGKTTLVNLLMRFYEVKKGAIYVDGIPIDQIKRDSLRRNFGMVLQDTFLFHDTIRNNIAYGKPDATDEEVEAAARAAGIHGFIRRLPEGYQTIIGGNSAMSQGQRQLLTIARIMLINPPILILDEATSSIDTRTELKIQAAFDKLMKGKTSFVIAHRLSTIKEADLILVMEQGNIIEKGTHEELLEAGGAYETLYNSQFPKPGESD
ncbi:ABC transporter ATP-binding protein [Anaerolentibacter hominis]|uniref:ABC transporter ATP-binding protein n=1 Tax=Anaerolentibacter hominis TaxID=3079009 RepID=UPI0031B8A9AC